MDEFQDYSAGSSLVYGDGIRNQPLGLGSGFPLDVVATFFHDPLRKHAQMTDERNTVRKDGLDGRQALATSLDFHQVCTSFAELAGILNSKARRAATACRQIGGHQCFGDSTCHGPSVVDHVIHRNLRGVWMPKNDHSQGVADQKQIEATLVEKTRCGVVVGRKRGQAAACGLGCAE